jgi:lipopolysaccharide biosynthesis glycosyltransferase
MLEGAPLPKTFEQVPLLFCVFEPQYHAGLLATLASMVQASGNQSTTIHVLTIKSHERALLAALRRLRKSNLALKFHDIQVAIVPSEIEKQCQGTYANHFSPAICYRLFFFDLVDIKSKSAIYFDLDTIWFRSPHALSHLIPPHRPLRAASCQPPKSFLDISRCATTDTPYFNSGVLLFNLDNHSEVVSRMRTAQRLIPNLMGKSSCLDQDALNIAFNGAWDELPEEWNFTTRAYLDRGIGNPSLLHATGSEKPWHFPNRHPYKQFHLKTLDDAGLPLRYAYSWRDSARRLTRYLRRVSRQVVENA